MKVTIEYKKSPDPEARFDRVMDIIRRDLERQAFVRETEHIRVSPAPPPRSREVAIAT
ncbi:MAG: hypothetical protein PHC49_09995 [Desulfuromonadaceae bacterium]|nr:hypothetical protein [Desulfuromonadaceae bacterium]